MTSLIMQPCSDEFGGGLEIAFHLMSEEDIIYTSFLHPEILQDGIELMLKKQGMPEKEIWKHLPGIFNVTTQHMKENFCERYTPEEHKERGLPF